MSSADQARSERLLNAIGSKVGLTECGRDWLISAVDPYHDSPLNVSGYPDTNEAASVVQVVKLSTTLAAPSGVSGNWDAHIHQFPWLGSALNTSTQFLQGSDSGNVFLIGTGANPSGSSWNGLSVDRVASGNATYAYAGTTVTNPFTTQLTPYLSNEFRVIGMGFEVINTTSELNIQGLVTSYRQPMPDLDCAKTILVNNWTSNAPSGGGNYGYMDVLRSVPPPPSTNAAMLLEGTRQWKAKEGCYVVPTMNSSEVPTGTNNCSLILTSNPGDPNYAMISQPSVSITYTYESGTLGLLSAFETNVTKFNHSGAYFSGLSNTTTLQLNAIYIIERFPTNQETDLVVLAKPSCRNDSAALELYSEVIRTMPTGVPQRMNGLGEWFADAVSSAKDFIAPVLSSIPHPYAQGAAAALKGGSGALDKLVGKDRGDSVSPGKTYQPNGMTALAAVKKVVAKVLPKAGKKKKK